MSIKEEYFIKGNQIIDDESSTSEELEEQVKDERKDPLKRTKLLQVFTMTRREDESGTSGKGKVLDGIIFRDGKVAVQWRSEIHSITIYDSYEDFITIHADSHPDNGSKIEIEVLNLK